MALDEAEHEAHEPLDISWPKGSIGKQISYICLFPIMIVLYLTLPDTRTARGKKFFIWGFVGSILWIAVFSYFMVWWADRTGETFGIAPEVGYDKIMKNYDKIFRNEKKTLNLITIDEKLYITTYHKMFICQENKCNLLHVKFDTCRDEIE